MSNSRNMAEKRAAETVTSEPQHTEQRTSKSWGTTFKNILLAKAPSEEAPLEYGGHRVAEEPSGSKLGVVGVVSKFARFFGPGMILAIPYIDPDNFQESVENCQAFGYKLMFMIFISIVMACYLQYLCLRMSSATGRDLAQMNHKYLPRWLELVVYAVAEACCIGTDISQVIGTALAWNLLIPKLPLPAACIITVFDTLIILAFYSPTGKLRNIRFFEIFIFGLVMASVVATAVMLGQVTPDTREVFLGFVPSRTIFVGNGLYTSCATIGGMLMPHALYVGSSIATPRLLEYDTKYHITTYKEGQAPDRQTQAPLEVFYRPSLRAIRSTVKYATWDLCISIFAVGMFVNCGVVIIAGAAFGGGAEFDDLYDLYDLLQEQLSGSAATAFAVGLLFSGITAGIVSTMAGQTVMEGAFQIKINPFARRLVTRCVAIIPALIVAVSVGRDGLSDALTAVNYVLVIGLIFVILPVVWYVTHDKYMQVPNDEGTGFVNMKLGLVGTIIAWAIWGFIILVAIATLILLGLGLGE